MLIHGSKAFSGFATLWLIQSQLLPSVSFPVNKEILTALNMIGMILGYEMSSWYSGHHLCCCTLEARTPSQLMRCNTMNCGSGTYLIWLFKQACHSTSFSFLGREIGFRFFLFPCFLLGSSSMQKGYGSCDQQMTVSL